MADVRGIIGVCISQAHSLVKTELLSELERAARSARYGVMVFNSAMDFLHHQQGKRVTAHIYETIRYDQLSALIILHENIYDEELLSAILSSARENHVPVLYVGGVRPGCVCIADDYEESYRSLLRHVIRDHGARNTFFIGGIPGEEHSETRLRCYREVLAEFQLPFREEQVAWCNYMSDQAEEVVRSLLQRGESMPGAIFCANDMMAVGVCSVLKQAGLRVPEDVIVTGFDNTPSAWLADPPLSTCGADYAALSSLAMDLIGRLSRGEEVPPVHTLGYRVVLSASCGCPSLSHKEINAIDYYRQSERLYHFENSLHYRVESLMELQNIQQFLRSLAGLLPAGSFLLVDKRHLHPDLAAPAPDPSEDPSLLHADLWMIPACPEGQEPTLRPVRLDAATLPMSPAEGIFLVNVIHAGEELCGYYVAHTDHLTTDFQIIQRLSNMLNIIFSVQQSHLQQARLVRHLENILYTDALTGLDNLKGLTRDYEAYQEIEEHRRELLALSVYVVPRYSYFYESYGVNEVDAIISLIAHALVEANPGALFLARISDDQFAVVDHADTQEELSNTINQAVAVFYSRMSDFNIQSEKPYFLEVNAGCTTLDSGWEKTPLETLIRLALGEMYLNRMMYGSGKVRKAGMDSAARYSAFSTLMDKQLFLYHFQPIVDARTGQIYAYEALMRTDPLIGMSPLEVLDTAAVYNRLDEVEKTTLFGIMERYVRDYSLFRGSRVFINTIPRHFLSQQDCDELRHQYEAWLDCFVFELTEQESTSDEELSRLKHLCKPGGQVLIAIDDYGTGHSNIVNLLRYSPQIIKIDRKLITDIQNDSNKQLFVRNTIDFAHRNGIKALAEGVETAEELRAVIEYGVDLIQGFYTARPAEMPIPEIDRKICDQIVEENLRKVRFDREDRIYRAASGEKLKLLELALNRYSYIEIANGEVTLSGEADHTVDMIIRFTDHTTSTLILDNAHLKGFSSTTIQLGQDCHVTLILRGQNTLEKEGIRVPPSSSLTITGDGDLLVINDRNYAVGIGASFNDPYGSITVDLEGSLSFRSSGDKVVCLGGSFSGGDGDGILLRRGKLDLSARGIQVTALGSTAKDARIIIEAPVTLSVAVQGNDVLLIGSVSGHAVIHSAGKLALEGDCERGVGIGTSSGTTKVTFSEGSLAVNLRCDVGVCAGSYSGEAALRSRNTLLSLHAEGNHVVGLGSLEGMCETRIESGEVRGSLLAGDILPMGNEQCRMVVTGGNFLLPPGNGQTPVGPSGEPLRYLQPEGDRYSRFFRDAKVSWHYTAERNEEGELGVWIP